MGRDWNLKITLENLWHYFSFICICDVNFMKAILSRLEYRAFLLFFYTGFPLTQASAHPLWQIPTWRKFCDTFKCWPILCFPLSFSLKAEYRWLFNDEETVLSCETTGWPKGRKVMAALYELVNIVDGSQPQLTPSELVSLTSSNLALIDMTRKAWFDWFFIFHVYINIFLERRRLKF